MSKEAFHRPLQALHQIQKQDSEFLNYLIEVLYVWYLFFLCLEWCLLKPWPNIPDYIALKA